jgi:NADH-quinone oxidoreductase subunit A
MSGYLGLFFFALLLFVLGLVLVVANELLAIKRPYREKLIPYECGLDPSGDARIPFKIKFYLIALIFLVFDVEVVFLYPWAVIFENLGWFGFVEIVIFVGMLLIAYIYAWSEGALKWE